MNSAVSEFDGKVTLVTGGTRGIGRAIAAAFLEAGAVVVTCGRTPPAEPVRSGQRIAEFAAADIRQSEQVQTLIASIEARYGRLDILVNNAGGAPASDPATDSARFSEAILRLNLLAPFFLAQAAYGLMQRQETGGVILNIGSITASRPSPNVAMYGAAKAGVLNLTSSLAVAWGPHVRVNAIIAGTVRTEQTDLHYDDEGVRRMNAIIPAGRLAEPKEIADACLFLASSKAAYITGAHLAVHGGGERPAFLEAAEKP